MCDGSDHKMCQRIPQMEPLFLLYEAGPRGFRCSSGVLLGVKPASRNSFRPRTTYLCPREAPPFVWVIYGK
jgi:hypothetical protein